jgi:DNA-nicking Smr family endonuclease
MKKKKKPETKTKEFVHTPFNALKGFAAEKPEAAEKAKKPAKPVRKDVSADERELFLRSMADVKKLTPEQPREKKKKPVTPSPSKAEEKEKRLFAETMKKLDVRFEDEISDVHPLRPAATNRLRRLKSGAIHIDLELDLHGMTRDEALESVGNFITGAYNRGQKAVLVITGKGNNSIGEPVLQAAVMSWLREMGKKMVAEFAPAPHQLGGAGALVVFLKDKDKHAS